MASVDDLEELIATRKLNGVNDNLYKENNSNNLDEEKELSMGEIIDKVLENPQIMIKQLTKMCDECKRINEELQIKLKNKQSEIDYLKGQLYVYEKILKKEKENTNE